MNAAAKIPAGSPLAKAPTEAATIMQVIERAATNPAVDVDKMARLLDMHIQMTGRAAKAAYIEAVRVVKRSLPVIEKNGLIEIKGRESTPYTLYEDIDEAISPILDEQGLVLTFRTSQAPDGRLIVTGVLSHSDGHEERTDLTLPYDSSGSKNGVQAVGSSLSYGKRYAATALLNLVSKGEDDDGESGGKLPSAYAAKKTDMGPRAADLANEINGLEGLGACTAWGNARAAEISTMPANWQAMLREDLRAQIAFLREQDAAAFRGDGGEALAGSEGDLEGVE